MGIVFHDGTMKIFKDFCNGLPWDDAGLLGNPPNWVTNYNTTARIKAILTSPYSASMFSETKTVTVQKMVGSSFLDATQKTVKEKQTVEIDFATVIKGNDDINVYVVKGLHQPYPIEKLHITVGFDGYLWHMFCKKVNQYVNVTHVTRGACFTKIDADGWFKS